MGKQSKAQDAAMRREYQEARRRAEAEKQRRQNRLMWQIVAGVAAVVVLITVIAIVISNSGKNDQPPAETDTSQIDPEQAANAPKMEDLDFSAVALEDCTKTEDVTNYVRMNISYTDKNGAAKTGDVVIRLFSEVAPKTVENFQNLVKEDFYDGLTFHRIIENFMIQGGAPRGDGTGDSGKTIQGEFTSNYFVNNLLHERGVVSMARGDSPNSASCQFFIVHETSSHLDGDYASFGYVVYGMDTVDGIAQIPTNSKDKPLNPVTINEVCFVNVAD